MCAKDIKDKNRIVKYSKIIIVFFLIFTSVFVLSPTTTYAEPTTQTQSENWHDWRDTRYEADDVNDDDWIGGDKIPKFDIMGGFESIGRCIMSFFYLQIVELSCGTILDCASSIFKTIGANSTLSMQLSDPMFNSIYQAIKKIAATVIQPVALAFLSVALVFQLLKFSKEVNQRSDPYSQLSSYIWIVLRYVLIAMFIAHTVMLCEVIYQIFLWLISQVMKIMQAGGINDAAFSGFMTHLRQIPFKDAGLMFFYLIIAVVLIITICKLVITILIMSVTRMFKIYIFTAFSGLPLAGLCNDNTKASALGYFKHFMAICLQAVILVVIVSFSGVFMTAMTSIIHFDDTGGGFVAVVCNLIAPIAGILAINGMVKETDTIASRIMGS